ncbi:MAG TPA: DUF6456 domain-containing protein [Alphaproteobacteria bacterium]|nr:DUF6456 domain-containing protein [Alphaproteobacteria bacterium]
MTRNSALTDEIMDRVAETETRKAMRRSAARQKRLAAVPRNEAAAHEAGEGEAPLRATPERARHDPVEALARAPFEDRGPDSRPLRVKDRWARMEESGTIDAAMRRAVYRFRRDFAAAGLESLRAGPLERLPRTGIAPEPTEHRLDARRALWAALDALGGASAPSGSIAWHCVGRDETVKDWALRQSWAGRVTFNETAARGVLVAALYLLQDHYHRVDKAARAGRG